jgi:ferredoxin
MDLRQGFNGMLLQLPITNTRRICQIFFTVLFFWFCLVTSVGMGFHQLRGWPVNWLLQLDPLAALGVLLSTGTVYAGMIWALATIVLTLALGRVFCGWICPLGAMHQFVGYLAFKGRSSSDRIKANAPNALHRIKYLVLAFVLAAAAGSMAADWLTWPRRYPWIYSLLILVALVVWRLRRQDDWGRRAKGLLWVTVLWTGHGLGLGGKPLLAASLQTGLLDPLPLVQRSVNLILVHTLHPGTGPRFTAGAGLIALLFAASLLANLVRPRFYCRTLCPLGALLGVLSRVGICQLFRGQDPCRRCLACEQVCQGACRPSAHLVQAECLRCLNCRQTCPDQIVRFQAGGLPPTAVAGPDLSRRQAVLAIVAGTLAVPVWRLEGALAAGTDPLRVRPPGALDEWRFLQRCLKCGQCMRICPTNVIQPAGLAFGIEALWTPVLNFRIGTSGCQLNCIACSHICPSAAIRPLSLDEKRGTGAFAQAGPVRIGAAFVDRNRCLPWAFDRPCIVCQENCPVSPKAIFTRVHWQPVVSGLTLVRQDGRRLWITGAALAPDRFASGDYFCRCANAPDPAAVIAANTTDALVLAQDAALAPESSVEIVVRLQRPHVDMARCIGCGICEHECPVKGLRAIRVSAENETRHRDQALVLE